MVFQIRNVATSSNAMQLTRQDHAIIHKVTPVMVYGTFMQKWGFKISTFVANRESMARTIQNS